MHRMQRPDATNIGPPLKGSPKHRSSSTKIVKVKEPKFFRAPRLSHGRAA